jgi:hypothetical protein
MAQRDKDHDRLDQSHSDLQKRDKKFDQERVDSRDHTKQSGKGEGDNALPKPAGGNLANP